LITFVEFNYEGFLFLGSDGCNSLVGVSMGVSCDLKIKMYKNQECIRLMLSFWI